eukprot:CAMPEP_0197451846 /NCGR_PEP_ID=MMETSP1175-20131217/30310_1 /TAXON_ID=1003142 /ORGANISM="Triceratium dubium, Strain CCMP147" /LENGTH=727 /DNA_ID=CAMNT_0042984697 /DNA_START=273 /DNA_END=2456 /DNA_ORIENTATION=-
MAFIFKVAKHLQDRKDKGDDPNKTAEKHHRDRDKKWDDKEQQEPRDHRTDGRGATAHKTEPDVSDDGYWLSLDRDFTVVPTHQTCYYCCEEGKEHPLEHFACYPCCGYKICLDCMRKPDNMKFCGECLTKCVNMEDRNEKALPWMQERIESPPVLGKKSMHMHLLVGRLFISGCHTFLDELMRQPIYDRLPPSSEFLAIMNPTNVELGVKYLLVAAEDGIIMAMLDLADTYNTDFRNDSFQKNKKKAEYWFRRALGKGNRVCPLAFTRYGQFLKWEGRFTEAKSMFRVAAEFGHARGQYEYALCLLEGPISGDEKKQGDNAERATCTNEEMTEAIELLCKASKSGFYVPSYILLVKTIIDTAEKAYGKACVVGKSPLPRALQILSLINDGGHGYSENVQKEAVELIRRYSSKLRCSNCGAKGSESNPLMPCSGCGAIVYCSKICQKREFRDGHKYDCCPHDRLFDFHAIKLTLPWINNQGWKGGKAPPLLQTEHRRSLMQMVEDDTDEIYGEEELDYDEYILATLMLRMRKNLETYLKRSTRVESKGFNDAKGGGGDGGEDHAVNLKKRIDNFAKGEGHHIVPQAFIGAMHKIREFGNAAAHRSPEDPKLKQADCEEAVREYRQCKEEYEIKKTRMEPRSICEDNQSKNNSPLQQTKEETKEPFAQEGRSGGTGNKKSKEINLLGGNDDFNDSKPSGGKLPPKDSSTATKQQTKRKTKKKRNKKKKN